MKIDVYKEPLANDTAMGYELRYLDFARMLMAEGITPHDLKEHFHEFEWVARIVRESFDRQIKNEIEDRVNQMKSWEQFRPEDVKNHFNKCYCEKILGDIQVVEIKKEEK